MAYNKNMQTDCSAYCLIRQRLTQNPDFPAVTFRGRSMTRRALSDAVEALAAGLSERGVVQGDSVAIYLPNLPQAVVAFYALQKIGAVANMIHPLIPAEGVVKICRACGTRYVFLADVLAADKLGALLNAGLTPIVCRFQDVLSFAEGVLFGLKTRKKLKNAPLRDCLSYRELLARGKGQRVAEPVISSDDTAVYLHSGGTTGEPKTIELSHRALNELANSLQPVIEGEQIGSILAILPLFHGFGLGVCMHTALALGIDVHLVPRFSAKEVAAMIDKYRIGVLAGVPTMYEKLLEEPAFRKAELKSLQRLFCGGDKLNAAFKQKFDAFLAEKGVNAELQEGYGLTEVVTVCALTPRGDQSDGVGQPLKGMRLKVVDASGKELPAGKKGELLVLAPTRMKGYLNDPASTEASFVRDRDGIWVRTGDCCYLDDIGNIHFVERMKRTVKIAGVNVYPAEIERIVHTVPGVERCCVVDRIEGGKTLLDLYVIAERNVDRQILEKIDRKLMKYNRPSRIIYRQSFPTTAVGKIDYNALRRESEGATNKVF